MASFELDRLDEVFDVLGTEECQRRMNDWERKFVSDISARWDDGQFLTDAQLNCLERIWVRMP